MPAVTVVVCTLDRSDSLRRTLDSLAAQVAGPGAYDVVVVDNGSRDATPDVVADAARRGPVRGVVEATTGLSHARNRGVREATGDVVAFIDDDAEAAPGWVGALAAAYEREPDAGAVGGRVELVFAAGRPAWLPARLEGQYSGLDLGDEPLRLAAPKVPYGTNMSVRRDLFEEIGGFSPALGRHGRSLLSMEENELFHRLRLTGAAILYEPAALVRHHVEPERVSRRYLVRRSFAQGRSRAVFHELVEGERSRATRLRKAAGSARLATVRGARMAAGARRHPGSTGAGIVDAAAFMASYYGYAVESLRRATGGT